MTSMLNAMRAGKTTTTSTDNGDGTATTVTTTFKADGTKSIKRKTSRADGLGTGSSHHNNDNRRLPTNASRSKTPPPSSRGMTPPPQRASRSLTPPKRPTLSSSNHSKRSSAALIDDMKTELRKVLGYAHADNSEFTQKVRRAIPADIVLLASQDDVTQAQEGDTAITRYGLPEIPNTHSTSGSLATCAFLQLLFENPQRVVASSKTPTKPLDCRQVITQVQQRVKNCSRLQEANPVISSSRPLGPPALPNGSYAPFYIVPPGFTGTRRALLMSVVTGEGADLKGPPNDIQYLHYFLVKHCGFLEKDIIVLRDDVHAAEAGNNSKPIPKSTKQNILDGFAQLVKLSKPKDVCFIQFSGHGGRLGDDLYVLPCDYKTQGQIMDYDILQDLIKYMPAKVHTTMLVDCCYSGVIGDLPYTLKSKEDDSAEEKHQEIDTYYDVNTRQEMMEKVEKGDPEYQEKKKARSKWRNVNRIATAAAAYAKEMAKEAGKAAEQASIAAGKAAHAVSEASKSTAHEPKQQQQAPAVEKKPVAKPAPTPAPVTPRGRKRTPQENSKAGKSPVRSATSPMPAKSPMPTTKKSPNRTKSNEEMAREMEEAARKAAVSQSQKEAKILRSKSVEAPPPRRSRSNVNIAAERDAAERQESKQKAAAARSKTPPPRSTTGNAATPKKKTPLRSKSIEDLAFEREAAARRAAVERSKREAAAARKKSPMRTKSMEDLAREREIIERREAVERSKREAAEARAAAGTK